MAALKCKMCGGPIREIGPRIGECEYCGTKVLLPLIDEERIRTLYNRGNHFREVGEYDRACASYESVIAQNRDDAEAHWCLMLCRYGINYVKDQLSGEFKPTISRMNPTSVFEDPDCQAAIRCSEGEQKEWYLHEAQKLADLQEQFLQIMKKEQPYDVFICFKAETDDGKRTVASEISQNIYEELTVKGLRVFFSRITLEDKIGEEYEPYIFSALYTAKVMLVVANEPSQLEARWVKNEWIRFLAMMDNNQSKAMIPVFYQMNPYDFPPEIPIVQGQDMEKLGAMQDLTANVQKLCGKAPETIRLVQPAQKAVFHVENALQRIRILSEDGKYEEALTRIEEVHKQDPENGRAWYELLLAGNSVSNWEDLMQKGSNWTETEAFQKARKFGTTSVQNDLNQLETACIEAKNYQKAKELASRNKFSEAMEYLKAAGDSMLVTALRKKCKEELEKEKRIQEFRSKIDTGYMRRTFEERYPKELEQYEKIKKDYEKAVSPAIFDFGWMTFLGVAVVIAIPVFMYFNSNSFLEIVAALALVEVLAVGICVGSLFESFWAGVITFGVLVYGVTKIPNKIAMYLFPGIAVIIVPVAFVCGILSVRWNSRYDKAEKYYKNTIEPMEKQIKEDTNRDWHRLSGKYENLSIGSIK